ncbi:MAG: phytase, partial [Anaerolineales bacterium]
EVSFRVYGSCMYHSPLTGNYYFFANSASGKVEQWELFDNGQGQVEGKAVRYFELESRTEGCVADDVFARFYIGEEHVGVWRYGAEPDAGETRTLVDTTKRGGHLTEDVEGLTLYYTTRGDGYLLVSSQGNDTYVAYERGGKNAYVMTFEIVAGNGIDEVTHTDGIDVTNFGLGPAFLQGVFVAQDNKNDGANQNYKLVPWQTIANSTRPPLTIDTVWDPRRVGGSSPRRDD